MTAHIILIRHGETDWNAEGRIQGHLPIPLNARGAAQAEARALHHREVAGDANYNTDQQRAPQTAEMIAEFSGHEIQDDRRLREWDLGILTGMLRVEADSDQPRAAKI